MRKITSLFCALLLGCIGAVAQTPIASLSELDNSKVYAIKSARDNGNGKFLLYDDEAAHGYLASNYSSAGVDKTFSDENPDRAFLFAIYRSAKTGFYYLYSIAGNMFVGHSDGDNDPIPMTGTITNTTEIRVKGNTESDFRFLLSTNGTGALNVAKNNGCHGVLNWKGGYNEMNDDGNLFSFIEIDDLDNQTIDAIEAAVVKFEGRSLSSINEIDGNHIYTLKTNRGSWGANQGFLIYHSDCPDNVASTYGSGYPNLKFSPTNSQFHWAIYKSEKTGKYYFYSVDGGKFIGSSTDGDSKPVALVSEITNDVEIRSSSPDAIKAGYPFVLSTNKWALNTADTKGAHGVVSWAGGYNSLTDGGNTYQISEIGEMTDEMKETITAAVYQYENTATITFVYKIGEDVYASDIVKHKKDEPLTVPEKDYVEILSHDFTNATVTEDATVNVACKENLPFTASADFDNATWYAVDIHSTQNNYYWTFVSDDDNNNVQTPPVLSTSSKDIIADNYLWCFVGNLIDGFKIYNKAAGRDMTLKLGTNTFVLSETDGDNAFKILTASKGIAGATCFTLDGTNFINHQTENGGNLHLLKTWSDRDFGSSCRFFAPSAFMLNCADGYLSQSEAPVGAVGTNKSIPAQLQTVVRNVTADPHNEDEMKTLSALLKQIDDNSIVEMVAGRYYRIQNYLRKDDAGKGKMVGLNGNGQRIASDAGKTDVSYIWRFDDCTENNEVGYKIYSPNQKGYMKPATDNSLSDTYQNGGRYRLVDLGGAQFNIKDGNNQNLVIYSGGGVGNWSPNPKDSDGAWYIIPATDIEIALNADEESNYWASTYLPFGVSAQEGSDLQIYTGKVSGEVLHLEATETLSAETGAILKGTSGTCTLNIVAEETQTVDSDLQGTLTELPGINSEDYLVLGKADGTVGLYTTNSNTLKANKAYLPASLVQGVNGLRFSFGEITGIDSAATEQGESKAALYDLSGRRVALPTHGIYVKDGKKILVR